MQCANITLACALAVGTMGTAGPAQTPRSVDFQYLYRIAQAQREVAAGRFGRAEEVLASCVPRLRNWEWHHLSRACRPEAMRLEGARCDVTGVAFGPLGRNIVAVTREKIRTYEARTGELLHEFPSGGSGLTFTADGRTIAVAGSETVELFDVLEGKFLGLIPAHDLTIGAVAFSPDGKRLLSCSGTHRRGREGQLRIWDVAESRRLLQIDERYWVNSAAFSPDGTRLAIGTGNLSQIAPPEPGGLRICDPTTGAEIRQFIGHEFWITSVAFSPDGRTLASASADKTVRIWNVKTGKQLHVLRGHRDWVRSVSFHRDGRRLLSASDDKSLKVWDAKSGTLLKTLTGHREAIRSAAFDAKSGRVVSAGAAKDGVRVWDLASEPGTRTYKVDTNAISSVAISADGRYLASARGENPAGPVIIRSVASGKVVVSIPSRGHHDRPCVAFSPDCLRFAVASKNGVSIRHIATGKKIALAKLEFSAEGNLAFSPNGKMLAVPVGRGATLVDAQTGKTVRSFRGHRLRVIQVAFSVDGALLATSSMRGYAFTSTGDVPAVTKVWDVSSGRKRAEFAGDFHRIAFAPHEKTIATGGSDGRITEWDAVEGKPRRTFDGSVGWIQCLAYSPDGRRLVSCGADRALRIWDRRTGMEVFAVEAHDDHVTSLAFCADGKTIVSGAADGTVRLWLTK